MFFINTEINKFNKFINNVFYLVPEILPSDAPFWIGVFYFFFFFNDTATTEIYTNLNTLSLHDALPISSHIQKSRMPSSACDWRSEEHTSELQSPSEISYAVFCLQKKKELLEILFQHASTQNRPLILLATPA